jgi:hypothetical protein
MTKGIKQIQLLYRDLDTPNKYEIIKYLFEDMRYLFFIFSHPLDN